MILLKKINNSQNGLTLIEIMIVVAIIGLITSFTLPQYTEMLQSTKDVRLKNELRTVDMAITLYYSNFNEYPEGINLLVSKKYISSIPIDSKGNAFNYTRHTPKEGFKLSGSDSKGNIVLSPTSIESESSK